jgi:hypothetical protein
MIYFLSACSIKLFDDFDIYYFIRLNFSFKKNHSEYFLSLRKLNFLKDENHNPNFKSVAINLNFQALSTNNLDI